MVRKESELPFHFYLVLFSKASLQANQTFLSHYNGNIFISPQIRSSQQVYIKMSSSECMFHLLKLSIYFHRMEKRYVRMHLDIVPFFCLLKQQFKSLSPAHTHTTHTRIPMRATLPSFYTLFLLLINTQYLQLQISHDHQNKYLKKYKTAWQILTFFAFHKIEEGFL